MNGCGGCFLVFIIGAFILYCLLIIGEMFAEFFFGFALPLAGGIFTIGLTAIVILVLLVIFAAIFGGRN